MHHVEDLNICVAMCSWRWRKSRDGWGFGRIKFFIVIYIITDRQTVTLYQNSSVWLDAQDTLSWDRNPFGVKSAGYLTQSYRHSHRKRIFCVYIFLHICYRLPECSIYEKSFVFTHMCQPTIPQSCTQPIERGSICIVIHIQTVSLYIYICIYIERE